MNSKPQLNHTQGEEMFILFYYLKIASLMAVLFICWNLSEARNNFREIVHDRYIIGKGFYLLFLFIGNVLLGSFQGLIWVYVLPTRIILKTKQGKTSAR